MLRGRAGSMLLTMAMVAASAGLAGAGVSIERPGSVGCAGDTTPPAQQRYSDPFAYCAAVQTIDVPDERYVGPAVPKSIAAGLQKAFGVASNAPEPFERGTSWRCMNGRVLACNVGANLPCNAKADTSTTPSAAVTQFCREQPAAEAIPAVVTGRETVYEWRCEGGKPAILRAVTQADARGYRADIWYEIASPKR